MVSRLLGLFVGTALCLMPMAASAQSLSLTRWADHGIEAQQISFHADGTMIVAEDSSSDSTYLAIKDGVVSEMTGVIGKYGVVGPDDHLYVDYNMVDVARYSKGSVTPENAAYFPVVFGATSFAIAFTPSGQAYALELDISSLSLKALTPQSETHTVHLNQHGVGGRTTDIKVSPSGLIYMSTQAGTIWHYNPSTQGVGLVANTGNAEGMAFDTDGNLYVADKQGNQVWMIAAGQNAAKVIITGVDAPTALTVFNNALYVAHKGAGNAYHISKAALGAPAAVPTLTEWAMILLALGLGAGAVVHLQGRKRLSA